MAIKSARRLAQKVFGIQDRDLCEYEGKASNEVINTHFTDELITICYFT